MWLPVLSLEHLRKTRENVCVFISVESRLRRVDILLNHLTEVVSEKDKIVGRLQSRAAENSLKIEAPFQKYVCSVNLLYNSSSGFFFYNLRERV